jgi:two-component system, LytTR family, response regulator AlgR
MTTILYIEDHPPAQFLMQAIVEELTTHQLLLANSGAEAITAARTTPPDLYIIDMDLPDTNGLALAQVLSEIHAAPMILVSAYAEAIKTDMLIEPVRFYLAKPLDPDHVADTIRRALA